MTLAEILKQNGVAEDTIRTIQNDMKTAKLFTTGEENADIRLGKLKGEHESVRQQLEAAQQKIAALEADKAEHSGSQEKMDEMHKRRRRPCKRAAWMLLSTLPSCAVAQATSTT